MGSLLVDIGLWAFVAVLAIACLGPLAYAIYGMVKGDVDYGGDRNDPYHP